MLNIVDKLVEIRCTPVFLFVIVSYLREVFVFVIVTENVESENTSRA